MFISATIALMQVNSHTVRAISVMSTQVGNLISLVQSSPLKRRSPADGESADFSGMSPLINYPHKTDLCHHLSPLLEAVPNFSVLPLSTEHTCCTMLSLCDICWIIRRSLSERVTWAESYIVFLAALEQWISSGIKLTASNSEVPTCSAWVRISEPFTSLLIQPECSIHIVRTQVSTIAA